MEFPTKNNYIYENLKDEIVEGLRKPGERITIPEVAKKYDVSSMPVREALNRLNQDGLVEYVPHVGARVMPLDLDKFLEITIIRHELEALATKLATPSMDEITIKKLEDLHQAMKECAENKDYAKYSKLNMEFHKTIYSTGPYTQLADMIFSLWNRSEFARKIFARFPERVHTSIEQHTRLLEAIKSGDSEKAGQLTREQNVTAFDKILAVAKELKKELE